MYPCAATTPKSSDSFGYTSKGRRRDEKTPMELIDQFGRWSRVGDLGAAIG